MIIGAGPAGLAAAHEAVALGHRPVMLEKQSLVGGIARTESYKGFRFDMGGHRFYTRSRRVADLWAGMLGKDFLRRPRSSRIYYRRKFFAYPIKPLDTLRGLGLVQSMLVLLSYLRWRLFPHRREDTYEQWVTNRFGRRLFRTFFESYTEKVWGIRCSELKAEWAAQRIKDLSLTSALRHALARPRRPIRTLIEEFDYPRLGPGMMWEAFARHVVDAGGEIRTDCPVVRVARTGQRVDHVVVARDGVHEVVAGTEFISTMPITELVRKLDPAPPSQVLAAAAALRHRAFMTVCLVVDAPSLFPDNWIYVHEPGVRVGRIQNFKNWSPQMVPDPAKTSLGMEYFCDEGDSLWSTPDAQLVAMAARELEAIGLGRASDVVDGCVFRVPDAYPVYDSGYRDELRTLRTFVATLENLQTAGRNGLHRYNNQDHAVLTGLLAARNLLLGEDHDLWAVNADSEYLEGPALSETRAHSQAGASASRPAPASCPS